MTNDLLARYLDRSLRKDDRNLVEHHLAECDSCRREMIAVGRIVRGTVRPTARPWVLGLAAAIAGILIVGTWPRSSDESSEFRASTGRASIEAIAPVVGEARAPGDVNFVWRGLGPSWNYRVTITTDIGSEVWQADTRDTAVTLPASIAEDLTGQYYWVVDAIAADGHSITSGLRTFEITR